MSNPLEDLRCRKIGVGGNVLTADLSAKGVRNALVATAEREAEDVFCLVQGKFVGDAVAEAGVIVQLKAPKPPAEEATA